MKYCIALMFFFLAVSAQSRIITDDYGRQVNVPERIASIYAASPPLTMSVVAFDPSLVCALNVPMSDTQKRYAGAASARPVAGGFFGQGNTPNYEIIAAAKPDVILMWGKMTGYQNALTKLSALHIPVIMVRNDSINDLIGQFELLGKLTGNTRRSDALVSYTKETLGMIESLQSKIDARKAVRYYFAEGSDGMSSECDGSFHLEPFGYAGGKNALSCKMSSNFGMEKMSMETILMADPDVIVAMEPSFAESVVQDPRWQNLRAVKNRRVLSVPSIPFNTISRPPSFMRLLGIRWLIHSFYPDLIGPMESEQRRFDKLFFPFYKG